METLLQIYDYLDTIGLPECRFRLIRINSSLALTDRISYKIDTHSLDFSDWKDLKDFRYNYKNYCITTRQDWTGNSLASQIDAYRTHILTEKARVTNTARSHILRLLSQSEGAPRLPIRRPPI